MFKWQKPQIVEASQIEEFLKANPTARKVDEIQYALSELFDIEHPEQKDIKQEADVEAFGKQLTGDNPAAWGSWFYFSWSNYLIHFPPMAELRALRSSRNRNLITAEEQKKLYDSTILIGGMSVGSNVVEALISSGIGGKLIIADMDIIEPSNLNRIRASYQDVGVHKVQAIAKKISEVDPYIEQIHLEQGLNKNNLVSVITEHQPDILVDEVDDLATKIAIRQLAKEHKLPVLMATDNGDDFILDVERYDTEDIAIFNGRIPQDIIDRILSGEDIPRAELGMVIGKYFVGMENISQRMMGSLQQVGKTIPSWPQLGSSAALSGIYVATYARYVLTGRFNKSGRIIAGPEADLKQL